MEIITTKYGNKIGLSCKVFNLLNMDDIINYFNLLRCQNVFSVSPKFKRYEIELMDFKTEKNKEQLKNILERINNGEKEILLKNSWARGVCYNICRLYGYKFEKIVDHGVKFTGCDEYFEEGICGCDYAPNNFWKYHVDHNYEDTIAYSNMPFTYKLGVRIIRN